MGNGKTIGLFFFFGGILLLLVYGLYQIVQEINGVDPFIAVGAGAIIIGIIVLIISVLFEQSDDMKKRKQEIKKEDFEP